MCMHIHIEKTLNSRLDLGVLAMEGVYNLLGSRRGLGGAREDGERWRQEGGAPGRDQKQRQEGLKGPDGLGGESR